MLYILDYGAGSEFTMPSSYTDLESLTDSDCHLSPADVRSLANSIRKLGYDFKWVESPDDISKASVSSS